MSPGGRRALIAGAAGLLIAGGVTVIAATQFDSSTEVRVVAPAGAARGATNGGNIDPNGFRGGLGGDLMRGGLMRSLAAAAAYIGISEEELRAELADRKTLAEVARAHGRTADGLVSAMLAAQKNAIGASEIPQAQKDAIIASLERRLDALVNGTRPIRPGFDRSLGPDGGGRLGPGGDGDGEGDDGPGGSGTFGGGVTPGGGAGSFGGNAAPRASPLRS